MLGTNNQNWTKSSIDINNVYYELKEETLSEIKKAITSIRNRNINLNNIEQEDFILESFASDVPRLRKQLDNETGILVITGLNHEDYTEHELDLIYWCITNYLGRIFRQNMNGDKLGLVQAKHDKLGKKGAKYAETNLKLGLHTDCNWNEHRSCDYLGMFCNRPAKSGGTSQFFSGYTLYNDIMNYNPDYIKSLTKKFPFDARSIRDKNKEIVYYPIFSIKKNDLLVHYINFFLEEGIKKTKINLTSTDYDALDFIKNKLKSENFIFEHHLEKGHIAYNNNRFILHDRTSFIDDTDKLKSRLMKRTWMWRRHQAPGTDPINIQ
tara:strand:+ start:14951 stop:15919 length:969 start_codon:yes stop_codon:yes gene_type:complete